MVARRAMKVAPKGAKSKKPVKKTASISHPKVKTLPKKAGPVLSVELTEKIKRRAKRAWEAPNEEHHRITEVKESTLIYRLPHEEGKLRYSGQKLTVKKDKVGRISITF